MKNEKAKNLDVTFQQLSAWALKCTQTTIISFFLFLHVLYLLQIQHWRACPAPFSPGSLTKAAGTAFAQPVQLQLCHTTPCSTQESLCSTDLLQQHPWLAGGCVPAPTAPPLHPSPKEGDRSPTVHMVHSVLQFCCFCL